MQINQELQTVVTLEHANEVYMKFMDKLKMHQRKKDGHDDEDLWKQYEYMISDFRDLHFQKRLITKMQLVSLQELFDNVKEKFKKSKFSDQIKEEKSQIKPSLQKLMIKKLNE